MRSNKVAEAFRRVKRDPVGGGSDDLAGLSDPI